MPRKHVRKPAARRYMDCPLNKIEEAISDVRKGMSLRCAAKKHNINRQTLQNTVSGKHTNHYGRP